MDTDEYLTLPGGPEPDPAEPADPAGPDTRRPLRRNGSDRVVAGVAAGLAEYAGVSSLAVRTLFGATAVAVAFDLWSPLAVAILVYGLLWIFIPRDDIGVSLTGRIARRFPRIGPAVGLVLLLVGAAAIAAALEPWLVWPVLLIGGGLLLYRGGVRLPEQQPAPSVAGPLPRGAEAGTDTLPLVVPPAPASEPPQTPRAPRERSPLGWLGMGVALLVVGVAAVLQNLGAIEWPLVAFPAVALAILGITMVIGAFVGRALWLVLPALLLVPFVLAASLITVPLEGGVGDLYAFPQSSGQATGEYRRIIGGINIDLTALAGDPAPVRVTASTGGGEINIVVPFDAHVIATGTAGIGIVQIGPIVTERQVDATFSTEWEPRIGDGATITLDLETGIGDIWVYRQQPTRKQLRELGLAT